MIELGEKFLLCKFANDSKVCLMITHIDKLVYQIFDKLLQHVQQGGSNI